MNKITRVQEYLLNPGDQTGGNICIPAQMALRAGKLDIAALSPDPNENIALIIQQMKALAAHVMIGTLLIAHCDPRPGDKLGARHIATDIVRQAIAAASHLQTGQEPVIETDDLRRLEDVASIVCAPVGVSVGKETIMMTAQSPHYPESHPRFLPHMGVVMLPQSAINRAKTKMSDWIQVAANKRMGFSYNKGNFFAQE